MSRVLIVDDEESIRDFLSLLLANEGYEVSTSESLEAAREALTGSSFDLVLCDIMMPDGSGLDLVQEIKESDPRVSVVVMTAYTSTKTAIEAMRRGAYDYLSKPFEVEELKIVVQKAVEKAALVDENIYLRTALEDRYTFPNIIGRSSKMQAIFALIRRIAHTSSTVLIHGESGTGKELIAHAIHHTSSRARQRFLSINCGALPEGLLESELFGHERGAFTGAVREKKGLFQEAHRGTVFLDEIAEMSPTMQVKLLRALQDKKIRKVGGNREETVDVRILAATNQDVEEQIRDGAFREDLYYRINVIPIRIPPLRQRRDDVAPLVDHFLKKYSEEMELEPRRISVEALQVLEDYEWPGNVRELENIIERALALTTESVITGEDIPADLLTRSRMGREEIALPREGLDLEAYLDRIRGQLMTEALEREGNTQTRAAQLLGMTFRSFRYYAKKLAITKDEVEPF